MDKVIKIPKQNGSYINHARFMPFNEVFRGITGGQSLALNPVHFLGGNICPNYRAIELGVLDLS
jgi:hypothetical protein